MPKSARNKRDPLDTFYDKTNDNPFHIEIGIDEAGRGPMFGRVYAAAVVLPKDNSFDHHEMKDSKRFHSEKKINEIADYIKNKSICWSVCYSDENEIDTINIRQATLKTMRECIKDIHTKLSTLNDLYKISLLLVDGNDFKPYMLFDTKTNAYQQLNHICIEGGDNKYTAIAAASILAKVERDLYIKKLCDENPELKEKYGLDKNKGYGTKQHLDGIRQYGISQWHRKTYGLCKNYTVSSSEISSEP
tara:strand:+ start:4968 stop:5708 length:741 start_codon:yes stop_codon:yes gene_type:complete